MASAVDSVFMVEASRALRDAQKTLLCGPDAPSTESKVGYHSTGKHLGKPIVWTETIISRHSIAGGPGLSTRCCRCCSWGVDPAAGFVCFAGAV